MQAHCELTCVRHHKGVYYTKSFFSQIVPVPFWSFKVAVSNGIYHDVTQKQQHRTQLQKMNARNGIYKGQSSIPDGTLVSVHRYPVSLELNFKETVALKDIKTGANNRKNR